jgi:curved DNA-binding protein CbpA
MASAYKDEYEVLEVPRPPPRRTSRSPSGPRPQAPSRRQSRRRAAEARFKEINEANQVLSVREKRKKDDIYGPQWEQHEQWERAGPPRAPPFGQGAGQPFGRGAGQPEVEYRTVSPEDLGDLFGEGEPFCDVFHDMFGGRGRARALAGAGAAAATAPRQRPRGRDGDQPRRGVHGDDAHPRDRAERRHHPARPGPHPPGHRRRRAGAGQGSPGRSGAPPAAAVTSSPRSTSASRCP